MCVLTDTHGRLVCADGHTDGRPVCADGHPQTSYVCWRTPTDVLCVLNRQPTWDNITQIVHGIAQRADSNDQRADMCTDGQPRMSCVCLRTHTDTHTDSHRRPVCADGMPRTSCGCWQTPADILCVLNRQPTWAKITRTIDRKGQRSESQDQCADMCTDGQPRTSCVC